MANPDQAQRVPLNDRKEVAGDGVGILREPTPFRNLLQHISLFPRTVLVRIMCGLFLVEFLFEELDFVAEDGGCFEVEDLDRRVHFFLFLFDQLEGIVSEHLFI